tara:strand:+ start:1160 stop:1453 length:294 start_codon:yes stop_codon:yes gene_type:complete
VAVSTQGLQINRVIVGTVSVYVVHVELAAMFRNEAAMQAGVFLVQGVWVLTFLDVSFIDSLAAILTSRSRVVFIADLYLGWTTNRADCFAIISINLR